MAYRKSWTLDAWYGRLDSGRLDAWTLDDWTLGRLSSEHFDSVQPDAWTLDAWTLDPSIQKVLPIFSDIYYFLIIIYCIIFKHFERSMTNVLWVC